MLLQLFHRKGAGASNELDRLGLCAVAINTDLAVHAYVFPRWEL